MFPSSGFYMMGTLVVKRLITTLSLRVSLLSFFTCSAITITKKCYHRLAAEFTLKVVKITKCHCFLNLNDYEAKNHTGI